jgi:hypothetical protein
MLCEEKSFKTHTFPHSCTGPSHAPKLSLDKRLRTYKGLPLSKPTELTRNLLLPCTTPRSRAPLLPTPVGWCRRRGPCNPWCCIVVCRPTAYCTTPWVGLPSPRASVPLVEGQLQLEGVAVGALSSSNARHFQGVANRTQRCGNDLVHVWPMAQAREPLPVDEGVRHQTTGTRPIEPSPECRTGS